MSNQQAHHQYEQAIAALDDGNASIIDKVEMLMEIAIGLQMRPKTPEQLIDAISLYERALELCPEEELLLNARIRARKATALQMVPSEEVGYLLQARDELETSLTVLTTQGSNVAADLVLGQSHFGAGEANRGADHPGAETLHWPYGVQSIDNTVVISDSGNNRVSVWRLAV